MAKQHDYTATVTWTGNSGEGTTHYRSYERTWDIETPGKPVVHCSNDPLLGGDPSLHNPEDILLASLAACHMLWYLHLASEAGVAVQSYTDSPLGIGETERNGASRFVKATLRPQITVPKGTDLVAAEAIHHRIHAYCFIARSVNFPIDYQVTFTEA